MKITCTVFSYYDTASGFCKTLSRRSDDDKEEEFLIASLTLDKYTLNELSPDKTCNSLDLKRHVPFDLNQMESSIPCTICKSNSIYFCS